MADCKYQLLLSTTIKGHWNIVDMLGHRTTISVYPFYLQLRHHCPVSQHVEGECNKKINRDFTTTLKFNYGRSTYFQSLSKVIQLFTLKFNSGSSNHFRSLIMVIQLQYVIF